MIAQPAMTTCEKYYLQPWIHGCISQGNLIILDIKYDRYIFIERNDVPLILSRITHNWPHDQIKNAQLHQFDTETSILSQLISANVITNNPQQGKIFELCQVEHPTTPFEHIECDNYPTIKWHHVIGILYAGIKAHLMLRLIPLKIIIKYIKKRRGKNNTNSDVTRSIYAARLFRQLRPLLIRNRICLYDSLSFYIFSKFFGATPTIVFGVAADPFAAHCWAQDGGFILNDVPQNIKQYDPIMTV